MANSRWRRKWRDRLRRLAVELFARPILQPLHHLILSAALHGIGVRNYLVNRPFSAGEGWFMDVFFSTVKCSDPVLFDVGANLGDYSAELLRRSPGAFVHAFEPGPAAYGDCAARFGAQQRVRVSNTALGSTQQMRTLFIRSASPRSPVASFYPRYGAAQAQRADGVEVVVDTIDDYCMRHDVQRIDLLKIDVEGHEFQVLLGAQRMLAEGRVHAIQFEFGEMHVHSRTFICDFVTLLEGYRLARLLPKGVAPLDDMPPYLIDIFSYQNIVAVRRDSALARTIGLDA